MNLAPHQLMFSSNLSLSLSNLPAYSSVEQMKQLPIEEVWTQYTSLYELAGRLDSQLCASNNNNKEVLRHESSEFASLKTLVDNLVKGNEDLRNDNQDLRKDIFALKNQINDLKAENEAEKRYLDEKIEFIKDFVISKK